MTYLILLAGLALLFACGDGLVRGARDIALRLGVAPFVIGATLVGFGTSSPELFTSVRAGMQGLNGVAVGNVVGSNIANILLILGVVAVIFPISQSWRSISRDLIIMVAVSAGLCLVLALDALTRPVGALGVALLGGYVWLSLAQGAPKEQSEEKPELTMLTAIALTLGCLAGVILGAELLVVSAADLAREFGVSDALIGLTIVAVGTSLPELAASAAAARRGDSAIAVGNIVGSNIFNAVGILGVSALVTPLTTPPGFAALDGPVMLGAALFLALLLVWRGRVGRVAGLALVLAYIGYIVAIAARG